MFSRREVMLFTMELHQCFSARRIPVFILLILVAIFLVVQESELSPMFIVFLAVFAILESQFNNILFRTPHELEALSMFPLSWDRIVLVKNIASIVLMGIVTVIVSMSTLYFFPWPTNWTLVVDALIYSSTIIFLLLHIGNRESVQAPRKSLGWGVSDLVQAVGMLLFVCVLSFPYILFTIVLKLQWLNLVYAFITGWFWLTRSIPGTALAIESRKTRLCTKH